MDEEHRRSAALILVVQLDAINDCETGFRGRVSLFDLLQRYGANDRLVLGVERQLKSLLTPALVGVQKGVEGIRILNEQAMTCVGEDDDPGPGQARRQSLRQSGTNDRGMSFRNRRS